MQYALRTSGLAAFTGVAWDHSSSQPRLATGSVDGTVIIWTAEPQPPSQAPGEVLASNSGGNLLGLDVVSASPQTSRPSSPTRGVKETPGIIEPPGVKDFPGAIGLPEPPETPMPPTINIIEATPTLTVPPSEKTLFPE